MKRNGSKTLKLVAATSVSLFSLLTVFVACYAWFSSNLEVKNSGATMNVQLFDRRFRRMTLHKFIGEDGNGNYQFKQAPSGTFTYSYLDNSTNYTRNEELVDGEDRSSFMEEYSLTSPKNPFLAVIEFAKVYDTTQGDESIVIKAETNNPFICATDPETGDFVLGLNTTSNPLSSVIKFSVNGYQNFNGHTGTVDSIATYNLPAPANNSWKHFVQIGTDVEGNYTYDNANGWSNELEVININGTPTQYVTIIFDYYEEALGYIYNKYLGDEVLERESVPFGCDWVLTI